MVDTFENSWMSIRTAEGNKSWMSYGSILKVRYSDALP